VVYRGWPTWEGVQVWEKMARMLEAYRDYSRFVFEAWWDPGRPQGRRLDGLRLKARGARTNLLDSVERLAAEPGRTEECRLLYAILASSHRLAHATMALDAGPVTKLTTEEQRAVRDFSTEVEKTLTGLVEFLKEPRSGARPPLLRKAHLGLVQAALSRPHRNALLYAETDRITNSVDTLSEQLGARFAGARDGRFPL
jgi:uncharacterized membrane protein YccC